MSILSALGRAVGDGMTLAAEILCPRDHTAEDRLRSWEAAAVAVEDEICDEADACEADDETYSIEELFELRNRRYADSLQSSWRFVPDSSAADDPGLKLRVCTWCNGPYFKCKGQHPGSPEQVWGAILELGGDFKEALAQVVGVDLDGFDDAVAAALQDLVNQLGLGSRFAVVALPEPCAKDDDGQVFFGDWDIRADCTGSLAYRMITTDFGLGSEVKQSMPPARAEWWARHLLAAAAEVSK